KGVPTLVKFFGAAIARSLRAQGKRADLICGANVLAQVPDPNDFVAGLRILLKPGGTITVEFPHVMRLIAENQFDTIYHEHFAYFSWIAVQKIFASQELTLFDVEELPTHGGSLRIYAKHIEDPRPLTERARELEQREIDAGLMQAATYAGFGEQAK